ncbi:uncharacterized protein LOC128230428 isoform X1 [Mya arenaria]|uniref:uncharacterized protein LOC128230428 isoform X1 n=1 Tax=Mya arenaria TaxID=6604 RepID=UPI0022E316FD|nr:uncharacterized protein LOC128230428 isoform X1 [Mya arenaria]
MVNQAGCQRLELINSNSLQKYIATVCQILDLNEGEVQWVSSHLAHTVKTHLGFYRLQEGAIEIAKVSRLLLAAKNGTLSKYEGKSLEDVQVDDLPLGESDDIPVHGESAYDSIDLNLAEHWNGDDEQPAEAQSSMPVNRSVPGLPRKDTYKSQTLKISNQQRPNPPCLLTSDRSAPGFPRKDTYKSQTLKMLLTMTH